MLKEVAFYKSDLEKQEAKLAEMKAQGADEYDIKKFAENVVADCRSVLPDSETRLEKALDDLSESFGLISSKTVVDDECVKKASKLLGAQGRKVSLEAESMQKKGTDISELAEGEAF
mmetsp:Transcript_619/g.1220  ORF Transcript_619/g.1220 Transcript_619/m.1220 type:complete len:117 (+) Transcript_619:464-814(+)|eukprot:CAMPEP_0113323306 /NCGR_PEP_ID=MMETSP0010_2-20120614/16205_1 /TAXON_ID=216773 ORGANISM="Corethron hystrix, Strain 308" /NCGR_SAMPLE_ID=MMETSP0010_2 /ASSEMBLY_ACC=CAM_ASM_000155 /LENGTH=116 /DNA_ID=CAMNT_0000182137 /DNA_START=88 /DNA_END=438 /DNA_ORIENTATION=+ /assembly_acc=CAM_ASM_000155